MKTITYILFLFVFTLLPSCNARQSDTALPKIEKNLYGELDYSKEALEIVSPQEGGKEIVLGKIATDGTVHFDAPEFDIKALYDSIRLEPYKLPKWFSIDSNCKDLDVFAKTPYDEVYSRKYKLFVKKYGINVAILESVGDSLVGENKYFWLYTDRAITVNEECSKANSRSGDIYASIRLNIALEKGWNFIEENITYDSDYDESDVNAVRLQIMEFSISSPASKNVKWRLRQIADDDKIQTAKRLDDLIPIPKKQFEEWVPNKLGDLSVTTKEYGNPPKGQKNKNNMHLIYANETQKKEIEVYVMDCAKSPKDMEMINFAYAMENKGKEAKDIKPYISQYKESDKTTQLWYKVKDRIVVTASGVNIESEELWNYIRKLKTEKLMNP
ncbi:hypothetical protein [Lacinutrix sp. MEBiC02595]